jgi:hypothetical protein
MNRAIGFSQPIIPYPCHFPRYSEEPKEKAGRWFEKWDPIAKRIIRFYVAPHVPVIPKQLVARNVSGTTFISQGNAVAYGGGRWVAGGSNDDPSSILYSIDGIVWQPATGILMDEVYGFSYGGGMWVAVGYGGNSSSTSILYSTDGIDWQPTTGSTIGNNGNGNYVVYANSMWVAVGSDAVDPSKKIVYSTNGIDWQLATGSILLQYPTVIAYGGGIWVAGGYSDNQTTMAYSNDGIVWQPTTGTLMEQCYGISYGNGMWVAVGYDGFNSSNNILYSRDGIDWQPATGSTFGNFGSGDGVVYANGMWVAVGSNADVSNNILYSTNGIDWQPATGSTNFQGSDVTYDAGVWVSVGYSYIDATNNVLYSTDGIDWQPATKSAPNESFLQSVAYGDNKWVAVGAGLDTFIYLAYE